MKDYIRLACYLVPPVSVYSYLDSLRQYVCAEIDSVASLRFPVHLTIQGFFKPKLYTKQAPYCEVIASARKTTNEIECFDLHLESVQLHEDDVLDDVLYVSVGTPNHSDNLKALRTLIREVRHSLAPFIVLDGANEKDVGYPMLPPHFTLAFKDIPQNRIGRLRSVKSEMELEHMIFTASELQLFEFESADWHDAWRKSLKWRKISTFHLKHKGA